MDNTGKPNNEVTAVGGYHRSAGIGRLFAWLRRKWQAAGIWKKVLVAGSIGILLLVLVLLISRMPHTPGPQPPTNQSPSSPVVENNEQPSGSSPELPDKPPATQKQPAPQSVPRPPTGGSPASGSVGGGGATGGGGSTGGTSSCALPNYPDASCTGVPSGTTLTPFVGNMSINTAQTVVEGKDIQGCIDVHAPGVIIRKSKIACDNFGVILSHNDYSGTGLLLEDVEISCNNGLGTAVGDYNITVRRANIHSCQNGFDVDGAFLIEDSYIHGLIPYDLVTDPHVDGVQVTPVGNGVTIRHNTIDGNSDGNSAITTPRVSDGIINNILIQDNLLFGGGYTLYCQQNGAGNNFRVINNHFSTKYYATVGAYAPWIDCQDEAQVTGNVYHETGQPVPF